MRRRHWAALGLGVGAVAVGVPFAMDDQVAWTWTTGTRFGAVLIAFLAVGIAARKIRGSLDAVGDGPAVPWATEESFATPAPERTARDPPLSSDGLAAVIDDAGATARESGTVADGLAVVRPALREALLEALEAGGRSKTDAVHAVATGAWTDDPVAASVLEERIDPPDRPLRDRVRAWLFPERVVRERSRRATAAVAEAADDALPTVPGQTAPRTVPVLQPRLEELERGADGGLQRAVDPTATARGPEPVRPTTADDGTRAEREDSGADASETERPDRPAERPEVTDA